MGNTNMEKAPAFYTQKQFNVLKEIYFVFCKLELTSNLF